MTSTERVTRTWTVGSTATQHARLHHLRANGGGQSLLLLHGLMGSGASWMPVARELDAGLDVVMPDARGHGDSTAPDTSYRYDELADDVVELIAHLDLQQPVVVGHSMGGMTAAVAAQRCTRPLGALVLVDPTFISPARQREVWESDVADQHRQARRLSKAELLADSLARHPHRDPTIVELQVEARLKTRMRAFRVLEPPNPDFRAVVRTLDIPVLLVIGDSPVVSSDVARELCDINPNVRVQQIAHAGHGLPFDQPGRLAAAITSFLREVSID